MHPASRAPRSLALLLPFLLGACAVFGPDRAATLPPEPHQEAMQPVDERPAPTQQHSTSGPSNAGPPASIQPASETPWLYEGSNIPVDRQWRFGVLDNGLRYATRANGVPPDQVSIRIRIDTGSLYEKDSERGFAHLIEHLLFRQSRYLGVGERSPPGSGSVRPSVTTRMR